MEGYSSDVALFQKPLVEEGIESYQFVEYRPSSTLSEGSSFEFHIPGSMPSPESENGSGGRKSTTQSQYRSSR